MERVRWEGQNFSLKEVQRLEQEEDDGKGAKGSKVNIFYILLFPIQYLVVNFYDRDEECLLRGTISTLKFNLSL